MVAYVRLKSTAAMQRALRHSGYRSQRDVADRAGISWQRLNQVIHGTAANIPAAVAVEIERVLGVPIGTLFRPDDAELLRRYLHGDDPTDPASTSDGAPASPPEHPTDTDTQPLAS